MTLSHFCVDMRACSSVAFISLQSLWKKIWGWFIFLVAQALIWLEGRFCSCVCCLVSCVWTYFCTSSAEMSFQLVCNKTFRSPLIRVVSSSLFFFFFILNPQFVLHFFLVDAAFISYISFFFCLQHSPFRPHFSLDSNSKGFEAGYLFLRDSDKTTDLSLVRRILKSSSYYWHQIAVADSNCARAN